MNMDMLIKVSSIGFRTSAVLFLLGTILTLLTYWKLNIRQIYLIKSGKARSRSISILEEHNRETGKLMDMISLEFNTEGLKRPSGKLSKTVEMPREELRFEAGEHSGKTEAFRGNAPSEMPEEQKKLVEEADRLNEGKDTSVLADVGETVQLNTSETCEYTKRIADAYKPADEDEDIDEPRVPMMILSRELIIHTNEIIDI
ncbi:MAG: hypothetical protein IKE52_07480 [Mogibacterium sp.]|nr:hypothetical protein [Mogibacterium sp.]